MNNFWRRNGTIASDSTTVLMGFVGKHKWVIKNWRYLVLPIMDQTTEGATLLSEMFTIQVEDDAGVIKETRWQIKAFPKNHLGQRYLAFKLICHSPDLVDTGSYYFKTYTKNWFTRLSVYEKFDALPLDCASNTSTCVALKYYPDRDLFIGVEVQIASKISDPYSPILPEGIEDYPRSVNELDLDNISDTPNPYLSTNRYDMPILTSQSQEESRQTNPVKLQQESAQSEFIKQLVNEIVSKALLSI